MNTTRKKIYIGIALAAVIIVGYWRYQSGKSMVSETQYRTAEVTKGDLTASVSGSGNVSVDQQATVDPTISGTVTNLSVKVGDSVKKGQLLFIIDNGQLGVDVAKAEASLRQAENAVASAAVDKRQASADYDAAKKKDKDDGDAYTSEQLRALKDKIDIKRDAISLAQLNLSATRASYAQTLSDAGKRRVVSLIDGTVNEVNIKNGDDLGKLGSSGSNNVTPIIIGDLRTLQATIDVNEVDIPSVTLGQKAVLTFDALEGFTASGKVEKIDALGTVNQGVVTYAVTIGFDTLDPRIRPQMSVSASIVTDVKHNVVTVPNSAVKSQGSASYVDVLANGSKTPERRTVRVGVSNATDTEILEGVSQGEKVVTQTLAANNASSASSSQGGFHLPGLGSGSSTRNIGR